MNWIWKFIARRRELPHREKNSSLCNLHDTKQFPELLETHYCKNCDINMCYMCSGPHYQHGCSIKWESPKSSPSGPLDQFNSGCKTSFNWPEVLCAGCGKNWVEGKEPTVCVACSNPTCSAKCHISLQDQDICTFYKNFTPAYEVYESINGFRAILYKSILTAAVGNKVTYASPRFMSAEKIDNDQILLQRGFLQYGNPTLKTQECLKIVETTPDYEYRKCLCTCEKCVQSIHPVYNCLTWCLESDKKKTQYIECWCICSECIQKGPHATKDCYYSCKLIKLDNTKN